MIPEIITIPLRQMASGDYLSLQVYKFRGSQPGKKVYIQSNLHGAEIAGNTVIHHLIEFLQTIKDTDLVGEIWLVPVCNPIGTNERSHHFASGRYCAYEGKDWNRIFWDYEKQAGDLSAFVQSQLQFPVEVIRENYSRKIKEKFADASQNTHISGVPYTDKYRYQLQSLSIDADYLIDLHSSSNQGLTYLYYFRDRQDSAKYFQLDFGILLDKYDGDAFDEAFIKPWLALELAFQRLGRNIQFDVEAWTLELGAGMQINPESVGMGVWGVKNYLVHKGVLQTPIDSPSNSNSHAMSLKSRTRDTRYYAPRGGMIQSRVELGREVKTGDTLYQIISFNKEGKLPTVMNIIAEQDGLVYDVATNQAVNEGEYVLATI